VRPIEEVLLDETPDPEEIWSGTTRGGMMVVPRAVIGRVCRMCVYRYRYLAVCLSQI